MSSSSKPSNVPVFNCVHRGISRLRAEELLLTSKQDGSFLVRESETIPGAYTLCILFEKHVHQYRILPDAEGRLAIQSEAGVVCRKYVDLTQLIHEYMQRGSKNGMAGPLLYPIASDSVSDDEDSADEEKVEDEADGLQFEVVPPSIDTEPGSMSDGNGLQSSINDFLYQYFLQRFRSLNLSRCDGPFINVLQNYIERGANIDAQTTAAGGETLVQLRHVMDETAKDIDRHVENLMVKIDLCRQLFGPITTAPLVDTEKTPTHEHDMASVFERILRCKSAVQNLEKKAKLKFTDLTTMWKEGGVQMLDGTRQPLGRLPVKPMIPTTSFEAKVVSRGIQAKIKLTVDIQSGKLLAIKPNKDCLNEKNVFTHDRIEQLVLSTANNSRLDVRVTGMGLKTYLFEDVRQRENFCQLVQQLKNMHSMHREVKKISFYVGTWNMGDEVPMYSLLQWIKSDGLGKKRNATLAMIPHDIYVFGTQESVLSDKEWTNRLKILLMETFGEEFFQRSSRNAQYALSERVRPLSEASLCRDLSKFFTHTIALQYNCNCAVKVALSTLWGIRLVIFAKQEHKNKISHVQQSTVKTGLANALGNKGAVGISFNFSRTAFCFICAHLTSGHEKNKRRNQNFHDILKGLDLVPKKVGPFDITKHFHHLFFFGDLNYRIEELDSLVIIKKIKESSNYTALLEYDQLRRTQQNKEAFIEFREEDVTFPPTYRFKKGTRDRYVWQKFKTTGTRINAPSYCDRILWHSYPETPIFNTSYGCTDRICSSDHKPVFATFDIGVTTQFTSAKGGSALSGDMKIIFEEIYAEVKTSRQDNFKIEFHSTCLEAPVSTKQNSVYDSVKKENYCCPKWTSTQVPHLQPIFDDRDYLEDQHLLVAVKTADGMESYGECVLALKSMFAVKPQKFYSTLTHFGEETGCIRGLMHVKAKENTPSALQNQRSHRIYDLIYTDVECLHQESDPTGIYQERPDLVIPSHQHQSQQQQPQQQQQQRRSAERVAGGDTLPMSGPGEGIKSVGISSAIIASVSTPCLASLPEAVLRSANALVDLSQEDVNVYEDVPTGNGPPDLPPRRGRLIPPSAHAMKEPGSPGLLGSSAGFAHQNVQPLLAPSSRRSDHTGEFGGTTAKSQAKAYSYVATNVYSNSDSPAMSDRPPLPLPEPQFAEKIPKRLEPCVSRTSCPGTIDDWLSGIGLTQYVSRFMDNGWDLVDFLTDMTVDDLKRLGIANPEHQSRILQSIERMNKRYA